MNTIDRHQHCRHHDYHYYYYYHDERYAGETEQGRKREKNETDELPTKQMLASWHSRQWTAVTGDRMSG